jgi:hypothetical protein
MISHSFQDFFIHFSSQYDNAGNIKIEDNNGKKLCLHSPTRILISINNDYISINVHNSSGNILCKEKEEEVPMWRKLVSSMSMLFQRCSVHPLMS